MLRQVGFVLVMAPLTACGCGSGSTEQNSPPALAPSAGSLAISLISPATATVGSSDLTVTIIGTNLDATPPQNGITKVIWSVNGVRIFLATTVNSQTRITAVIPAALLASPVTAQVSVQAGDPNKNAAGVSNSLTFSVDAPTSAVFPGSVTLGTKGSQQFTANIDGSYSVNWSIEEGADGGSITSSGFYTAPAQSGTFHVIATSSSELNMTAVAIVTITNSGFTATGTMHVARHGHTATLLNDGRVLILGGGDATAELFDPAHGTFSYTGPPVTGRLGATATLLLNGRVLIAGGLGLTAGDDGFLPLLDSAEVFDPATGTFSASGSLQQGRWNHVATLLNDGHVLITGGRKGHICSTASAEVFDAATGIFSSAGLMLSERAGHTATLLASGDVLIAGGFNGCAPDAADDPPWDPLFAELFEPNSRSFQADGTMSTTRIGHAAIRLDNGKVLLLGGIPAVQNLHEQPSNPSYAELYDSRLHIFSPVAGLSISQAAYSATFLNSGMVLIAGGATSSGKPITDVLLLDPDSGALASTGSLGYARSGHTATLLHDGRVLVAGGTDSNGKALLSAELYQ